MKGQCHDRTDPCLWVEVIPHVWNLERRHCLTIKVIGQNIAYSAGISERYPLGVPEDYQKGFRLRPEFFSLIPKAWVVLCLSITRAGQLTVLHAQKCIVQGGVTMYGRYYARQRVRSHLLLGFQ